MDIRDLKLDDLVLDQDLNLRDRLDVHRDALVGVEVLLRRDVEAFRDVLVERYGFQADHIQLLLNRDASRPAIIARLRHYANTLTADDNFILYYSGHGILDKTDNEGYWLVHGCDIQNYASDGMANQDVLRNIRAQAEALDTTTPAVRRP